MTYATLMVHLELGHSNAGLLRIAGDLAQRCNARVIGVAACQPTQIIYGAGYISGELIEREREEIETEAKTAEAEFRTLLQSRVAVLAWRSTATFAPLSDYLTHEARSADLVVTGVDRNRSLLDSSYHVDIGNLVLQAGRPVLIVPATADRLTFDRILVGWKDTREARRAVYDALPLLKQAAHVVVAELAAEDELAAAQAQLADVAAWLKCHGVAAESVALRSVGDAAAQIEAIADDRGADLIVAGAYGHSRLHEWVLGGVTRDLLLRADRCSFVSH
jgi:nucleotide-binding universal stress UspA family protein